MISSANLQKVIDAAELEVKKKNTTGRPAAVVAKKVPVKTVVVSGSMLTVEEVAKLEMNNRRIAVLLSILAVALVLGTLIFFTSYISQLNTERTATAAAPLSTLNKPPAVALMDTSLQPAKYTPQVDYSVSREEAIPVKVKRREAQKNRAPVTPPWAANRTAATNKSVMIY